MKRAHPEVKDFRGSFCIKKIRTARTDFLRGITEAVLLRNFKDDELLNNKQEYNCCLIPEFEAPGKP